MPMKTRSQEDADDEKSNVIPVKFERKAKRFEVPGDVIARGIYAGSVVTVPNVVGNFNKEFLARKTKDEPPEPVESEAANDPIIKELCQDSNKGLYLWLKAFNPIPKNVCPWPVSYEVQIKKLLATQDSESSRLKNWRKPQSESRECFRYSKRGVPNPPVLGWGGLRPPTVRQLLVQAANRGVNNCKSLAQQVYKPAIALRAQAKKAKLSYEDHWNFAYKKPKVSNNLKPIGYEAPNSFFDKEYWRYHSTLLNMSHRSRCPSLALHETNIVKARQVIHLRDTMRYAAWLYKYEVLNPFIDHAPVTLPDGSVSKLGCRYEGRKAAEFASHRRHFKRQSVYGSPDWDRFLCYYQSMKQGFITPDQLLNIGKYIWGETTSLQIADDMWKKANEPDTRKSEEVLLLPPPAKENKQPSPESVEKAYVDTINSKHCSGRTHGEVFDLIVRKGWKNLPNMLIQVPESYKEDEGVVVIPFSLSADKHNHLKTG